ncbi:hypothetical protein KPL76_06210 [Subtercola sp. PAMC28395]|uniref:hypothetical protein n=1 Tax=Subtercola sp. PAMC28395 TaxID=2846775 RepID=UPI001C0E8B81|nr:hypothetical protein [Subtercola sp. PAMC28395]QWT24947.1 hypothetical protein KPL76_06210 [Subtercola sp. PAMC28395]
MYTVSYDKPDGIYHPGDTVTATFITDNPVPPVTESPVFGIGDEQVQGGEIQIIPTLPAIVLSDTILAWSVVSQDQNTIVLSATIPA